MTSSLVHSSYPVEYFALDGVDQITYPQQSWWASRQRYAAVRPGSPSRYLSVNRGGKITSEYLEIDLGRVRQINFLTMNVFKVPVNITIQYDTVSAQDGTHQWTNVKPLQEMEFDSKVRYRPSHKNPWEKCNYYFTDRQGNIVNTRYLRIRFQRVDRAFPTRQSDPIRYPIMVKALRTARVVSGLADTVGPLFNAGIDDATSLFALRVNSDPDTGMMGASETVRQNFVVPDEAVRGARVMDENDMPVFPSILGFGILVENSLEEDEESIPDNVMPEIMWEIVDVTDPANEMMMRKGHTMGAQNKGRTWMNVYFHDNPIEADPDHVYQLRVHSMEQRAIAALYRHHPNNLPGRTIPGTLTWSVGSSTINTSVDTTAVVSAGDRIMKPSGEGGVFVVQSVSSSAITLTENFSGISEVGSGIIVMPMFRYNAELGDNPWEADYDANLTMCLWGDVADSGRDILGNQYRYATHRDKAEHVFDGERAGWVSAPMPDPNAVEALYFDVRTSEPAGKRVTVIDALRVAALIPGVRMHVYYTDGWVSSAKPSKISEWESMLWKPVPWTFELRGDQQFRLPSQIAASFIKLEFTNLKPRTFRIPRYPELPPVHYRRYPTWIEAQFENAQVRRTVNDWFVKNRTKIMRNVLKTMDDPMARFQYKLREFLAFLALGRIGRKERAVKEGLIDLKAGAYIDPVTASKIFVNTKRPYKGTLKVNLDQDSLLGQMVANAYDPNVVGDPVEGEVNFSSSDVVPIVSTVNDRVTFSYAHLAQTPMWFNRPSRHRYRREVAKFNKKAFFAGVSEVAFLRSDFTVARDDEVISEMFVDEQMVDSNTFELSALTNIESGQTVYVSYELPNPGYVQNEAVTLTGSDRVRLEENGDDPAINVRVFAERDMKGREYILGQDFDLSYETDEEGKTANFIERNTVYRRTAVRRPPEGYSFRDAGMVVGQSRVPVLRGWDDENVVVGVAEPFAAREYFDTGTIVGIGAPVTTHESKGKEDTGTIVGVAVPSGTEDRFRDDAATVQGQGTPSAITTHHYVDPPPLPFVEVPLVTDPFSRSLNSWGTTPEGYTWASSGAVSTDGEQGILVLNTVGTRKGTWVNFPARVNTRMTADVAWDKNPVAGDAWHRFSIFIRGGNISGGRPYTGYWLQLQEANTGTLLLRLGRHTPLTPDPLSVDLGSLVLNQYTPGEVYRLRLEAYGTSIKGKAWRVGTPEPDWQITATDSGISSAGIAGVWGEFAPQEGASTAPLTYTVDNVSITTDPTTSVGVGVPLTTSETRIQTDAGTVTGVSVPSGSDTLTNATVMYFSLGDQPSGITPAYASGWTNTTQAERRTLSRNRFSAQTLTNKFHTPSVGFSPRNVLFWQFSSVPLAAQTISGNIVAYIQTRAREGVNPGLAANSMVVKVVSNDGSTLRGTLLSAWAPSPGWHPPPGVESYFWNYDFTSRRAPVVGGTMTPVAAQTNDRLVVELGYFYYVENTASYTATYGMRYGAVDDATLITQGPTDTDTTHVPWIMFTTELLWT